MLAIAETPDAIWTRDVSGRPLLSAVARAKAREEPDQERPRAGLKREHVKHWATSLLGELGTKANSRRGQRAGMLSRSWLRFVLITALSIATGRRARQHLKVRRAHLGSHTPNAPSFLEREFLLALR